MKKIITTLWMFSVIAFSCGVQTVSAQGADDIFARISSGIQTGNVSSFNAFLGNNVEIALGGRAEIFSPKQGAFVLQDFITKHPVSSFKFVHKGSSGNTHYAVGTYKSTDGTVYDANIFVKSVTGELLVTEIRFEKD